MPVKDDQALFNFQFSKPKGALHWLVVTRIRLGWKKEAIENLAADALQLFAVGSFDKKEQAWLDELTSKQDLPTKDRRKAVKRVKRVSR